MGFDELPLVFPMLIFSPQLLGLRLLMMNSFLLWLFAVGSDLAAAEETCVHSANRLTRECLENYAYIGSEQEP